MWRLSGLFDPVDSVNHVQRFNVIIVKKGGRQIRPHDVCRGVQLR